MERRKERGFEGFEASLIYLLSLFPVKFTGCIKHSRRWKEDLEGFKDEKKIWKF